jgi:predicted DNA-binding protein (UPF0251 family)
MGHRGKRHRWGHRWKCLREVWERIGRLAPSPINAKIFIPVVGSEPLCDKPVIIYSDEFEAYRLVYLEGRTQEEAAAIMGISRGSLWRLLYSARRKIGLAILESRPIVIVPA